MSETKSPRRWLRWAIGGVWVGTALAVLIATRIHPATVASASLHVRKISFRTNTNHILGPGNEAQLLLSGVRSVQIHLSSPQSVEINGARRPVNVLDIVGDSFASCSFYQVRSDGFDLKGTPILTLGWDQATGEKLANNRSFSLNVHGSLSGNLTSQAAVPPLVPGFTCTRVRINGGPPGDVESRLSPQGSDSIFFTTTADARLDFDLAPETDIGDTQIPILGDLRFWDDEPGTGNTKTVLLGPENKVAFEKVNQSFILNEADLLLMVPKNDFYLRRFALKDGIQLNLHGVVREVRSGAGASDLETRMPSFFDHVDSTKRLWGAVPALVAFIIGVLDQLGKLSNK